MKLKLYFITLFAFLAIDSLWLGFVAPSFYRSQIGFIMSEKPNFLAAGIFYLLFVVGLLVFVIKPGIQNESITQSVIRGGLFGLVTYATYDLTNLVTLQDWPILVTVVDMIWGTVLCGLTTWVSVWAGKKLKKQNQL